MDIVTCANPQCGKTFEQRTGRGRPRKYCSKSCLNKVYGPDNLSLQCEVVDCERPVRARKMCSMHWRRWARATGRETSRPWSPERLERWQARQDRKRATQVEPIRNLDIFERDGWTCGICGGAVNSALTWPDPLCPTLDHITPLSKGGTHTSDNVQCAHARCNISKGNLP